MIYEYGFVKFNGVDDYEDSPVAACLNEIFIKMYRVDSSVYVRPDGTYQRCANSKYSFSRDQTIMLLALFYFQGRHDLVSLDRVDGKDIFPPSVRGHERRCKGLKANWFQNLWLKAEILSHAYVTPKEEPNQLLAMAIVAGDEYVKMWMKHNKHWEYSILRYFCKDDGAWRGECYLAYEMVSYLKRNYPS